MVKSSKPWDKEMWSVSPYNFDEEALAKIPKKVGLLDTTLRDGISDPARSLLLNVEQKLKIAQALDDLGIGRLEIGLTTDEALPELKAIVNSGIKAKTFAMTPTSSFLWDEWKAVDIALKAGISGIICNFPSSEYLIRKYLPGWTPEKMLEKSVAMSIYAKKHGLLVNFFEYDTTRAEPMYLRKLLKAAVGEAKVDSVSIVDTLGVGSPAGIAHMVKLIKKWVKSPIELHMHDDFGLAFANCLAGIGAGAEIVQTTINGIGKMPATEDLITSLRILYDLDLGVKYGKVYETTKTIREIGNWTVSPYRPISGELAFGYDSDTRIDENRSQRAPFLPEFIGNKYRIVLSGRTGPQGIRIRLNEIGKTATDEQVIEIMSMIKRIWEKERRTLNDGEFKAIVEKVIK